MSPAPIQLPALKALASFAAALLLAFGAELGCARPTSAADGPRLVSLSPGVTEIIEELELGTELVGISQFCQVEHKGARTIGSLYTLDTEVLLSLQPTHVFYQGNPGRFDRLMKHNPGIHVAGYRLQTLDDVVQATKEIAELTGHPARGVKLAAGLNQQLHAIRERAAKQPARPVAFVIPSGTGQYLVAATGNFIDTLIETAGGINVGAKLTGSDVWQTISREHLLSLGAELIIVHGQSIGNSTEDDPARHLGAFIGQSGISLKRVASTSERYFTVPSNKLGAAAEEIFELVHPPYGARH